MSLEHDLMKLSVLANESVAFCAGERQIVPHLVFTVQCSLFEELQNLVYFYRSTAKHMHGIAIDILSVCLSVCQARE